MATTQDPIRPQDYPVSAAAMRLVPQEDALTYRVCPLALALSEKGERLLTLACERPDDLQLLDTLSQRYRCRVQAVPASAQDIALGIAYHYSLTQATAPDDLFGVEDMAPAYNPNTDRADDEDRLEGLNATQLVNRLFQRALAQRATDIHLEPHETQVYVRFRVDGILSDYITYPAELHASVAARIKILTNVDAAQSRLPQDGRFDVKLGERQYDVRVSLLPTVCGESVVLRLLPKGALSIGFDQLGLTAEHRAVLEGAIHATSGMVLLTGPTGSGKTTTLYACLSRIDCIARKVITIEDPVEYQFHRIAQTQVHPKIGLTFAAGLRSILRQDPDIIMVGEIRDLETLEIAIHAALTGHLVLSTLHCNDAAAAAARMVDMGAEPFLVASSVSCLVAQRLVRTICAGCKEPVTVSPEARAHLGLRDDGCVLYHGRGCARCAGTGYYGRTSVFEVMPMTGEVADAVARKASAGEIRRTIRAQGVRSLRDDGLDKVCAGLTTLEEVMRAVHADPG